MNVATTNSTIAAMPATHAYRFPRFLGHGLPLGETRPAHGADRRAIPIGKSSGAPLIGSGAVRRAALSCRPPAGSADGLSPRRETLYGPGRVVATIEFGSGAVALLGAGGGFGVLFAVVLASATRRASRSCRPRDPRRRISGRSRRRSRTCW